MSASLATCGRPNAARAKERFEPMEWTLEIKPRGIPERPDPPSEEPLKRPTGPAAVSASHLDRT